MKKLLLSSIVLSFCLMSCTTFVRHDFSIKNDSDKTVSFTLVNYTDENVYTLAPDSKITLNLYDNPKINILNNERVVFVSGLTEGKIYNQKSYSYIIKNNSEHLIYLSEKNNSIGDPVQKIVEIPASKTEEISVFTNFPTFSAYYVENGSKLDALNLLEINQNTIEN